MSSAGPSRSIYSVSVSRVEPRPRAALYLIALGSLLVLLEAILFLELGQLFVGVFLFATALLVYSEPYHHLANGILALVLALVSLLFGFGGFYLGAILAGAGGVASIVWSPPRALVYAVAS